MMAVVGDQPFYFFKGINSQLQVQIFEVFNNGGFGFTKLYILFGLQ